MREGQCVAIQRDQQVAVHVQLPQTLEIQSRNLTKGELYLHAHINRRYLELLVEGAGGNSQLPLEVISSFRKSAVHLPDVVVREIKGSAISRGVAISQKEGFELGSVKDRAHYDPSNASLQNIS